VKSTSGCATPRDAFVARAARFAHALTAIGLRPGDRLAVQVEKSPDALALYGACTQAGIVLLPLNTGYTSTETEYFLTDSGAAALVCAGAPASELAPVAKRVGARLETLGTDGTGTLADRARDVPETFDSVDRNTDDLAALLYTSGTTGRSKGAMLTQGNLLSNAEVLAEAWRFTRRDVLLHALPIFHTHGLFVATNVTLVAGAAMIFLPKFDIDAVIGLMPRATSLMGVPTFYTRLLDDPRLDRALTAHMRLFVSGSAPLLEDTHARFEARTGHQILERYGMTETGMNTSNPYDGRRRPGTVGRPLRDVELRITGPGGTAVPDGEVGQIEVRGPNVFRGYWRMPEKTAAETRADGFFMTGDLGAVDPDGYVRIVGRAKDLVISGGYNVYPKEVEAVLDAQPGVRESAVVGVPHPDLGECVLGLIVPDPGAKPDLDALAAAAGASLARFKCPRKLIAVEELPRNAMGKVQKAVLREAYRDAFAHA
jgi:malonyl-CoA/methylmalonyl-CoA synthetase